MGIVVLGAGIQGTCVALELARRGFTVELLERDAIALNRASLRNEAKIHLGFTYAQDRTMRTARLMLRGALSFRRLLSRWTNGAVDRLANSTPFYYVVPEDSLRSLRDLTNYYVVLQELYEHERRASDGDYLGSRPARLWRPLEVDEYAPFLAAERIEGGVATVEASISMAEAAEALRRALAGQPGIRVRYCHRVTDITRTGAGFRVAGRLPDGGTWHLEGEQVVNALWDQRLAIDHMLGLKPDRPWVNRLKHRVLVELPERLAGMPSYTFALGLYGDVVTYANAPAYVSWYPECMQGWSTAVSVPEKWHAACTGRLPEAEQRALGARALDGMGKLIPGLAQARILTVDAGVIFAWGSTDIDDPESDLHHRYEIGVHSVDGYHSIDTGKLTTAPLFAVVAADRICGRDPSGVTEMSEPGTHPHAAARAVPDAEP